MSDVFLIEIIVIALSGRDALCIRRIYPLRHSHHLVKRIYVNGDMVSSCNVVKLLGHPVGLVDHVLLLPVSFILPVANEFPSFVLNIV